GFPAALMFDDAEPYHYVRLHEMGGKRWAIIGGEDHKVGHDDEAHAAWDRLEAWARQRFPVGAVEARWSGQILEPFDGLPLIGASSKSSRIRVATGYSGNGVTWGTVAAEMLTAQVLGGEHPLGAALSPRRLALRRRWSEYVVENLDFPRQLVRDRLQRPQPPAGDLAPGEGRVVRVADHDVALSRDTDGTLHAVSAICTHMACRVAFNDAEKSWDCPCHGSRFALDGAVLNGPATRPLKAMALDEDREVEEETERRPGYEPEPLTDPGV
ncbi:MAG TPA: FAD-dependent oxidoreductase, partial [Myxococcaceae bacterium]|nr:FAD-dependent oxidoreductase [Myxococcaceae bacterium]